MLQNFCNIYKIGASWVTNPKLQDNLFQFLGSYTQYEPLNMLIIVKSQGHSKSTNKPCSLFWAITADLNELAESKFTKDDAH